MQNYNSKFKSNLIEMCYRFSLEISVLADTIPKKISAKIILGQLILIRAATSIGANLVEVKASSSRLELKKFHEIALKSANETKYWLCLLRDAKLTTENTIKKLLGEVTKISNMIASGVLKLKNKKF